MDGREPNTKPVNIRMVRFTAKKVCKQRPSSGKPQQRQTKALEQASRGTTLTAAMETMQSNPQDNENFGGK